MLVQQAAAARKIEQRQADQRGANLAESQLSCLYGIRSGGPIVHWLSTAYTQSCQVRRPTQQFRCKSITLVDNGWEQLPIVLLSWSQRNPVQRALMRIFLGGIWECEPSL